VPCLRSFRAVRSLSVSPFVFFSCRAQKVVFVCKAVRLKLRVWATPHMYCAAGVTPLRMWRPCVCAAHSVPNIFFLLPFENSCFPRNFACVPRHHFALSALCFLKPCFLSILIMMFRCLL
jgi:hypothetical protein